MRKLATAAIAFSAAVFAANYIISYRWLIPLALIFALAGAALLLLREKWIRPTIIFLLFFALGLGCFYIHGLNTTAKVERFEGQVHRVQAEILNYPEVYDDYCRLEVKVTSYYLPNLKAYLYDNDMQLVDARPGDAVTLKAKVSAANTLYGEAYRGYYSKSIYFKLSSQGDIELKRGVFNVFYVPQHVSHWLSSRIETIFPDDTQVFMRSLMLGDKTDFYGDETLYVSMSRAGLMHIVAVSGMHVGFLVTMLYYLFGKGKRSAIICLVLVWCFALMTGFGPSVVRAAFMCSTVLFAPVLRRENDSITSLSTALALILCANPYAAASVALQLSFAAMASIVLVGGKIYLTLCRKLGFLVKYKFLRTALMSVSTSLSVIVFTAPLTAVHFGIVPLLSPISNLMSLWAVSYCFCGGWISCALSVFPYLGEATAWICSWLARYIFFAAEMVSSIPFALVYAETKGIWLWMGISYVLFFGFYLTKLDRLIAFFAPVGISACLVFALLTANKMYYKDKEMINLLDVGQGQCITIMSDEATAVVDCGNINSVTDAGTIAASRLYSRGREYVDFLLLSHLHADHADGAVMLMETMKVYNLLLPADCDDSDELYAEMINTAEKNGTNVIKIDSDTVIECGDIELSVYKAGTGDEENERCLISKIALDTMELLVLSDATAKMQRQFVQENDISEIEAVVVAHHGSKYACCEEVYEALGGRDALISVGNNYFGHPSEETLEALEKYGYNVYRTDIDETLEITVG